MFMTESAQVADVVFASEALLGFEDLVASYGHRFLAFNEKGFGASLQML